MLYFLNRTTVLLWDVKLTTRIWVPNDVVLHDRCLLAIRQYNNDYHSPGTRDKPFIVLSFFHRKSIFASHSRFCYISSDSSIQIWIITKYCDATFSFRTWLYHIKWDNVFTCTFIISWKINYRNSVRVMWFSFPTLICKYDLLTLYCDRQFSARIIFDMI